MPIHVFSTALYSIIFAKMKSIYNNERSVLLSVVAAVSVSCWFEPMTFLLSPGQTGEEGLSDDCG